MKTLATKLVNSIALLAMASSFLAHAASDKLVKPLTVCLMLKEELMIERGLFPEPLVNTLRARVKTVVSKTLTEKLKIKVAIDDRNGDCTLFRGILNLKFHTNTVIKKTIFVNTTVFLALSRKSAQPKDQWEPFGPYITLDGPIFDFPMDGDQTNVIEQNILDGVSFALNAHLLKKRLDMLRWFFSTGDGQNLTFAACPEGGNCRQLPLSVAQFRVLEGYVVLLKWNGENENYKTEAGRFWSIDATKDPLLRFGACDSENITKIGPNGLLWLKDPKGDWPCRKMP